MKNPLEHSDIPLVRKLMHAFNRVQVAMRAGDWEEFGQRGLHPTQGQILLLLYERSDGLRVSEIAEELMVSAPTVSDSIRALSDKGYVHKTKVTEDARVVMLQLTTKARKLVERLDIVGGTIESALSSLPEGEKLQLYRTMLRIVRELQANGKIPVARMCITCRYFRPHVHEEADRPHHCALVDAAFGDRTLRSDCPDHEAADRHLAAQNWEAFVGMTDGG